MRVSRELAERLQRKARQLGRTPSETGALLLEEGLRRAEFAFIDFRDSPVGRQAYVVGSRLAVWQVAAIVDAYEGNINKAAKHFEWPMRKIQAAMSYAAAFPDEINQALTDAKAVEVSSLERLVPQLEVFPPNASQT